MCIHWTRVLYSVVKAHLFHNSIVCVMNSRVSGQCSYTISTEAQTHTNSKSFTITIAYVCLYKEEAAYNIKQRQSLRDSMLDYIPPSL